MINPKEKNTQGRLPKIVIDKVRDIRDRVTLDLSNRSAWERKLVYATNQRMGIKRMTNTPYPGAPDIPLPETDKMISKKKPEFVLSVVGQKSPTFVQFGNSISQLTPELMEKRRKSEAAFNMIISNKIDIVRILTTVVDQFLEKGHGIFEIYEEFNTKIQHHVVDLKDYIKEDLDIFKKLSKEEKRIIISDEFKLDLEDEDEGPIIDDIIQQFNDGNEIVEYDILEVESMPKIFIPQTEDIIVPSYTMDIDSSERLTERIYLTERQLRERAINGIYDKKKVEKLFKEGVKSASTQKGLRDTVSNQKNANEGIQLNNNAETWLIYKVSCYIPRKSDGRYERWVISYLDAVGDVEDSIIQAIKFPYEFDGWNYVKHDYETRDGRYFSSRGIPEKISAVNEFMERCFNNMLIRDEINNNPIFSVLNRSRLKSTTNRFIPGQVLRVNSHDEVQEVGTRLNRVDLSSNLMIDKLKAFIEEYLASTDQLFRNSTNAGGGKTLGEIQLGVQLANSQVSIDILLFNETLKKVYKKIWSILKNRIGKPFFVNGEYVTSDDFDFDADIMPTGSAESLNRQYEVMMAQQILAAVMQQIQIGQIVMPENLYNAFQNWLEKSGTRTPERFITRPEIVQQAKMAQAQAQQQQLAQMESQAAERIQQLESQGAQLPPEGVPNEQ